MLGSRKTSSDGQATKITFLSFRLDAGKKKYVQPVCNIVPPIALAKIMQLLAIINHKSTKKLRNSCERFRSTRIENNLPSKTFAKGLIH